jgi:phosphatidylglycerophosphate synthase
MVPHGSLAQATRQASGAGGPYPGALADLGLVAAGLAVALAALPFPSPAPPVVGMALFAVAGAIMLARLGRFHPHERFGLANGITVFRGGGAAVFVALALEPGLLAGSAGWAGFAAAALLLGLDGLDGLAARRQGLASAFGARFDMEVDAVLILALAALALGLGKTGPWVLGLGLVRYGFVLGGLRVPALARPLPPSRRRRAVCALQVAVLGLMLAPPVVPPVASALAAAAFAALLASFAVDTAWLLRRAR